MDSKEKFIRDYSKAITEKQASVFAGAGLSRSSGFNVGEMNPDSGYTDYEDWVTFLDTSFTPDDLLESPAALFQKLQVHEMQKSNLIANIAQFLQMISNDDVVKDFKEKYDTCEKDFHNAFDSYIKQNPSATMDMFKTVVDIIAFNSADALKTNYDSISYESIGKIFESDVDKASDVIKLLKKDNGQCMNAQSALLESSDKAVNAAMNYFIENNKLQFKGMLEPLQQQLKEVNEKITDLKQQIALSTS
jgi:hypothetical protein